MATTTFNFDKPSYGPREDFNFTVTVDVPMTSTSTVTGTIELPDGTILPAEDDRTVFGVYGPFTTQDPNCVITQDPINPALFHGHWVG